MAGKPTARPGSSILGPSSISGAVCPKLWLTRILPPCFLKFRGGISWEEKDERGMLCSSVVAIFQLQLMTQFCDGKLYCVTWLPHDSQELLHHRSSPRAHPYLVHLSISSGSSILSRSVSASIQRVPFPHAASQRSLIHLYLVSILPQPPKTGLGSRGICPGPRRSIR